MEKTKKCSRCGQEKPLEEFSENKSKPDRRFSYCKQCRKEYNKEYRKAHGEQTRQAKRKWYRAHPEKSRQASRKRRDAYPEQVKQYYRKWREAHSEQIKQYFREWQKAHPEQTKQATSKWQKAHPEQVNQKSRKWRKNNKDRVTGYTRQRRAKKKGLYGSHAVSDIKRLKELQGHQCLACGKKEPIIKLSVDHIVPVHDAGWDSIENLQLLCQRCNSSKGKKTIDYRSKALKKAIFEQLRLF